MGWMPNLENHLFPLEVVARVVFSQEHKMAKLRVIKLTPTMKPLRLSERNCHHSQSRLDPGPTAALPLAFNRIRTRPCKFGSKAQEEVPCGHPRALGLVVYLC
jgi:hypothetical protein